MIAFLGLDIALRGLQTQQQALEVASHNIANANTPGYRRQAVDMIPTPPITLASGTGHYIEVGTGVTVTDIRRVRDTFLDAQFRQESGEQNRWQVRATALSQIEGIFNEPSDTALRSLLDQFWDSWQALANDPENQAARASVREAGQSLADAISNTYQRLLAVQSNINQSVRDTLSHVNDLATQIADLNRQVLTGRAAGGEANDLEDRRDVLLDELAGLTGARTSEAPDHTVTVFLGGVALVDGSRAIPLSAVPDPTTGNYIPRWQDSGTAADLGGTLAGQLEVRDQIVPGILSRLDQFANAIVAGFNQVHMAGYGLDGQTGRPFFDPQSTAAAMRLSDNVLNDLNTIAASASGAPGDGSNALALANVKNQPVINGASLDQFLQSIIGQLGAQSQEAQNMEANQTALVQQITNEREQVSGVSLDEESTNLIRYQHAYAALARVISTVDDMLNTLINATASG